MDPKITKCLEEDEFFSEVDVEASAAELNRYIGGNDSIPQQPSDSNAELTRGLVESRNILSPRVQTSSPKIQGSDPQNRKEGDQSSHEPSPLLPNPSIVAGSPQSVGGQPSGEHPISVQVLDHDAKPDKELQINKLQSINHHPSMSVGSNDQQPLPIEFNDQQILPTSKGNQQTDMGINNDQVMPPLNHHTTGMAKPSQQTSTGQQSVTSLNMNDRVPMGRLFSIIKPLIDKDRVMQVHALFSKLKKNEISKDVFIRYMRSIVGQQKLKFALYKLRTQTATNQFQPQPQGSGRQMQEPAAQLPTDVSNSISDNNAAKSREEERQADSHGTQVGQMSTSSSGASSLERKHAAFPTQGLNKQQHMQFTQAPFPQYGSDASSAAIRPQAHGSQMRQIPSHSSLTVNHLGPASRPMHATNMSTFDRPHSLDNLKKLPAGSLTRMNCNTALRQNEVKWPSSTSKELKTSISPSMTRVKHEPSGISQPTTLAPSSSVSSPSPSLMETNILSSTRMPSLTAPVGPGNSSKASPRKPLVGQKKPMKAPGSSPPSSKKQKVSGSFVDQSIEHFNDVTAMSGVNLMEEEELLFSGCKKDSQVSEAFRRVVQQEEKRLILQRIPLQKKMMEITAKFGLKTISKDAERCLSLSVEERMRQLISTAIRLSKQRVDIEKPRHKTVITSDVRPQIMAINRKASGEWEKKQAETEKSQKNESSAGIDADKDKDDSRGKLTKVNKEENGKMRMTAANAALRAASGVNDITSRWLLMMEAKQKQGGSDTSSAPQTNKDVGGKPAATSKRNTKENQESEKLDSSITLTSPASVRKVGRNQVVVPQVARSVSVKDVVAALEREPQMSKSTLLYRLYLKVSADTLTE